MSEHHTRWLPTIDPAFVEKMREFLQASLPRNWRVDWDFFDHGRQFGIAVTSPNGKSYAKRYSMNDPFVVQDEALFFQKKCSPTLGTVIKEAMDAAGSRERGSVPSVYTRALIEAGIIAGFEHMKGQRNG